MTKSIVLKALSKVIDPELNVSIVDMGFVYGISIAKDNSVNIKMTLTTPGCPLYKMIEEDIKKTIKEIGAKKVTVEFVFDPPWSTDLMTKKGKKLLGFQ